MAGSVRFVPFTLTLSLTLVVVLVPATPFGRLALLALACCLCEHNGVNRAGEHGREAGDRHPGADRTGWRDCDRRRGEEEGRHRRAV